jgi:acyl-CoA hydrolase
VSSGVQTALEERRRSSEAVLDHVPPEGDVIVGLGNGEPVTLLDAIEAGAGLLRDVRIHQTLPLRDRAYINGEIDGLRHVSWFLSPHDRDAFHRGKCDLVPNSFSDVPRLMETSTRRSLVLASVSPPDRHGYFSLDCHAEYTASMIGEVPFFVEVNGRVPRTFGENQLHASEVVGWCEADYELVELPTREPREADRRIAELPRLRLRGGQPRGRVLARRLHKRSSQHRA